MFFRFLVLQPAASFVAWWMLLFAEAPICRADLTFDVSLDTSGLKAHPAGPFYVDFQLNDGSGTGDQNNTVTINHFMFGDGQAVGSPLPPTGGASGNLSSSVSIADSGFVNEFTQQFNPGDTLSFRVELLTTNVETPGHPPDAFSFSILDSTLAPIPTTNFADAFLFVNIRSVNLTTRDLANSIFAGDPTRAPVAGGEVISIGKPQIPGIPTVPESGSSIVMLLIALGAVTYLRSSLFRIARPLFHRISANPMNRKLLGSFLFFAIFSICNSAFAATFLVNTTADTDDKTIGDGVCDDGTADSQSPDKIPCSLRAAIQEAKSAGGNHTIKFIVEGTIKLSSSLPILAAFPRLNLVIKGPGANFVTVEGGDPDNLIFSIVDTVTIGGLTITKGGRGAISNVGHLVLQDCVITDNTATTGAGAIFNTGSLTVKNCTISKNVVRGDTHFRDGAADGGAIVNGGNGTAKILNSTLNGNAAFGAPPPHGSRGSHASGGAIKNLSNGTVTLINSTVSGNVARGGDTGVFLTAFRTNTPPTEEDAETYYERVDLGGKRKTLGDWWRVNGFDPENGDPVVYDKAGHAAYFNNNDLGFGRDTTILRYFGNVASWLGNYSLTPPYPDQNPLSADAALARDPGRGIAAVCMEYSQLDGSLDDKKIVKFFVYNGVGPKAKRVLSADLDGYGLKPVPYLCTTCHGGQLPTAPRASDVQKMNSFFREFDLASFKFPRPGFPIDHPIRSAPDTPEQIKFFEMNNLVLNTNPSPAIKELIKGWYRNSPSGQFQDPNFVPSGWQHHPDNPNLDGEVKQLYQHVVATSCRTCHVAGASSLPRLPDFSTFASFSAVASLVKTNVFQYNNAPTPRLATMPHSMIAFKNFWKSENPYRPTVLANALTRLTGVFSAPEFDGQGANGGSARGGGVDNENGKVTIAASTVAFNTASGGIGFSAIKNNDQLDLSSSIGMGDAGGVFSDVSLPSRSSTILHSSIIAENFSDTDHFTDNIALRRDDIFGTFYSEDFNLIGASHEFFIGGPTAHNKIDVANPGLGLLRNNGGPTLTHALLGFSPAIDSGDNEILNLVTTDQRGFARKISYFGGVNGAVDIGAFEARGTERDITSQMRITRGGFYFNRATQRYEQQLIIQNIGNTSINRPLRLALDGVTVALHNEDGTDFQFGGIPFVTINTGNDGIFSEMERVSVTLEFTNPLGAAIMYRPRVLETTVVP